MLNRPALIAWRIFIPGIIVLGMAACAPMPVTQKEFTPSVNQVVTVTPNSTQPIFTPSQIQVTEVPSPENISYENSETPTEIPTPAEVDLNGSLVTQTQNWQPILYQPPFAIDPHEHFYFVRPIPVNMPYWLESNYRYGYIFPGEDMVHSGIDIAAPMGTPIYAAASGTVTWAGHNFVEKSGTTPDPYGLAVAIRHDFGFEGRRITTIYAHMSRIDVKLGQYVTEGEQLGLVGNTGFTTGPHLHFEIRLQSPGTFTSRNPELWIVPPEGDGVLVGRVLDSYGLFLTSKTVSVTSLDTTKTWTGYTYGPQTVRSDDYYLENFVLGDLPTGKYQITIYFNMRKYQQEIQINQGLITTFSFSGYLGFVEVTSTKTSEDWLVPVP
jgi:murein DD-endopeptidase MepM/ murein hydrolase activator NlpD